MKKIYFLLLLGLIISIYSCEVRNPDEDIPAHINISKFNFEADVQQGTDSVEIVDSWIFIDDELIGAFEMPFTIPALQSGIHKIEIKPGIILNGIASTRTVNPFYTSYKTEAELIPGETISFYPHSSYNDSVKFPWNSRGEEDFEEGGISIDSVSGSSTKIFKTQDDVYQGFYSGKIHLDQGHKNYSGQSSEELYLPKTGRGVIMEIHIKNTNTPLLIGMKAYVPGGMIIVNHMTVNTGTNWKKLNVNFTELVSHYPNAEYFKVTFDANLGDNETADIYLDNIKIMHF